MKIAVVTPGILPVPPLKGGAVETLVETLISENEKHADFDIDLFSVYADGIEACAEPYRRTRFHFIKISPAGNLLIRICNKMLITLHIDRRLDLYMKKLRRYVRGRKIDRNHYDAIIVENSYQVISGR